MVTPLTGIEDQRKKTGLRNDALGTAMFEVYAWLSKYS